MKMEMQWKSTQQTGSEKARKHVFFELAQSHFHFHFHLCLHVHMGELAPDLT